MHAHPMITPLLPLRSPAEIEATYPADAAMAYALIWANTLGHLKARNRSMSISAGMRPEKLPSDCVRWLRTIR